MFIPVRRAPEDLMSLLKDVHPQLAGRCFENCVIAVLGFSRASRFHYVLGLLAPPGYSAVPHAWLFEESVDGPVYLDPTLQYGSFLWQTRAEEFIYDERYRLSRDELLAWFRSKYVGREFDDIGVPTGLARGPMIISDGLLD